MLHSRVTIGFKRFGWSLDRPFTCQRLQSRHANAFPIICSVPNKMGLGLTGYRSKSDIRTWIGRCFSKEITETSSKSDQDLLLHNLASAVSTSDVLDIVGAHHSIMNSRHSIQALRSLFELQKSNNSSVSKQEILKSSEFIALCKGLKSQARAIELKDTIQALKMVTYLGVPSTSIISQVLLQLVRHSVNDLSLQQIVFLDFLLKRMEHCPIVDALQIALPLVFEAQLSVKLDRSNLSHLAEMLQYASRKSISGKSVETVVEALTTLANRGEAMDVRTAKTIVWALCDNRKSVPAEVLLQKSTTALAESIDQCTFDDIEEILAKLVRRISRKHMEYYHEDFMDSCASYVIKKDCGFESGIWILRKLTRIAHTSIDLLNYLGEKIVIDPNILHQCRPHVVFTLVTGFSNADYKPANWHIISNIILNHHILEEGKVELPWLKFAVELAALGCFSSTLLERLFQEDFLKQFLSREYNLLDHLQLLSLHQAVVTMYPTYGGPFPPDEILEKAIAYNGENIDHFPLAAALARGLGGPAYVQTKLYTRLGHCIDHVIVMRKGGFPVTLSLPLHTDTSKTLIEDLEIPADSQIVAVIALHPGCYSLNCSRLRGNACLLLRSLEALNLSVVAVSMKVWSNLPEQEKIPYLMQAIKIKCAESEHASALQ